MADRWWEGPDHVQQPQEADRPAATELLLLLEHVDKGSQGETTRIPRSWQT